MVSKIRRLPPGSQLERQELGDLADWGHLAENVARLVDLVSAWLNYEYASWTADPDEVKAARRGKRKPPPSPIVPPVAARPRSLHEQLAARHEEIVAQYSPDDPGPRLVSIEEFDAFIDQYV